MATKFAWEKTQEIADRDHGGVVTQIPLGTIIEGQDGGLIMPMTIGGVKFQCIDCGALLNHTGDRGTIQGKVEGTYRSQIVYDDGEEEQVDLSTERYKLG